MLDTQNRVKRQIVPRLKPVRYGEILTTEEVLQKQKDVEEAKKQKTVKNKNNQKTKPKKKRKMILEEDCQSNASWNIQLCQDSSDYNIEEFNDSVISQNIVEIT